MHSYISYGLAVYGGTQKKPWPNIRPSKTAGSMLTHFKMSDQWKSTFPIQPYTINRIYCLICVGDCSKISYVQPHQATCCFQGHEKDDV